LEDILKENRFNIVSEPDKAFIIAFDKAMNEMGYDFGKTVSMVIKYGKAGTKSRPCPAYIEIKENGILLRLYLNEVDTHNQYIKNTQSHIKDAFIFNGGDCGDCSTFCAPGKIYTIDGQQMKKCKHNTFYFNNPTLKNLPDYMELLSKFYLKKSEVKEEMEICQKP
jgi:hypothetical protein